MPYNYIIFMRYFFLPVVLRVSPDSCKIHSDVITIDTAYAKIELSSSISDERLLAIIKAVRYA